MRLTSLGLLSTIATGKSLFTFTNGKFFHQSAPRYIERIRNAFFLTYQRSVVIDQSESVFHPKSLIPIECFIAHFLEMAQN